MSKTILITGSTDGIGLAAAKLLVEKGHHVLIHGRNQEKLDKTEKMLNTISVDKSVQSYLADLSHIADVKTFVDNVVCKHAKLDVLINNAGVYAAHDSLTQDGLDVRFAVNTIAPYLLTQRLLPLLGKSGRVINLSSAAQSPVNPNNILGKGRSLSDNAAYAQSKLAIIMWSRSLALSINADGPTVIAVNPGSLLGTKMVKEAYGMDGADIHKGADILVSLALDEEFAGATGQYFDNDSGEFSSPHPDALDVKKSKNIVEAIETVIAKTTDGVE